MDQDQDMNQDQDQDLHMDLALAVDLAMISRTTLLALASLASRRILTLILTLRFGPLIPLLTILIPSGRPSLASTTSTPPNGHCHQHQPQLLVMLTSRCRPQNCRPAGRARATRESCLVARVTSQEAAWATRRRIR